MPGGPLEGVRVVEAATHVFAPMAGGVLAEWGADVLKIEPPATGDPYRSLVTAGLHRLHGSADPFFQSANRAKRSVAVDLRTDAGRGVLGRLLRTADVFVTNLRGPARAALRLDVEDVRADRPDVIYVRATAFGPIGPDADRGGYDTGAYWARSGMQDLFTAPDAPWPTPTRPSFGDVVGALAIAAAVSAALYRRARSGTPSVIDASLLASGMWQVQNDVVNAALGDTTHAKAPDRYATWNPLMLPYRTADDRFVLLMSLAADRHWSQLCELIGRPQLAADPRYATLDDRKANARACVAELEEAFAARDLATWQKVLAAYRGEWTVVQTPAEVHHDPQVEANGYVAAVTMADGGILPMVSAPAQFDERPSAPTRAPELGEHTEAVLLEVGYTWADIESLKDAGAII